MKKLISLCAVVALLLIAQDTFAQNKLGIFLGYGTDVDQAALGVNGELGINSKIAISPSFVYWFPPNSNTSRWEINGNMNYYFQDKFYGLCGLNFFHLSSGNFDKTYVGVNAGVGYNFDTGGKVIPFGEAKFVISDADQLALFFGIKIKP